MSTQFANIYQALCENCPGVGIEPPWGFVPPCSDCVRITDLEERFAAIRARFSEADMLSAGLAVEGGNGAIAVNPKLLSDDGQIVVLRNKEGTVFDILTGGGCLSGAVPALTMHKDREVADALGKSGIRALFVTFTLAETILLRSMGVAAAPATDLDRLSVLWLQRLLTLVDGRSDGGITREYSRLATDDPEDMYSDCVGPEESEPPEFALVFVAGSILSLGRELPVGLRAVARHLADAQRYLNITWGGLYVWWPSPEELGNLAYRRRFQSSTLLREFFDAERDLWRVSDFVSGHPPQGPGLAEKWLDLLQQTQKLQNERNGSEWHKDELKRVLAEYASLVDAHVVLPLANAAFAQSDLRRQCAELQMAYVVRLLQGMMPGLHVSLADLIEKRLDSDRGLLPAMSLKQMESLTKCLIRLDKQLPRD
jgi:hypothetical protein